MSNPILSIYAEMRAIAAAYPHCFNRLGLGWDSPSRVISEGEHEAMVRYRQLRKQSELLKSLQGQHHKTSIYAHGKR